MSTPIAFLGEFGDAIDFILHSREARSGGTEIGGANLLPLLWEHLALTGVSVGIALAIALPLALWLGHIGKGELLAVSVSNVGRAVPSLALIGSPSVTTPASGAIVAVAITLTTDVRMPPNSSGRASGSSIRRTLCSPVMPMPRAASTTSRSTWRTPT